MQLLNSFLLAALPFPLPQSSSRLEFPSLESLSTYLSAVKCGHRGTRDMWRGSWHASPHRVSSDFSITAHKLNKIREGKISCFCNYSWASSLITLILAGHEGFFSMTELIPLGVSRNWGTYCSLRLQKVCRLLQEVTIFGSNSGGDFQATKQRSCRDYFLSSLCHNILHLY